MPHRPEDAAITATPPTTHPVADPRRTDQPSTGSFVDRRRALRQAAAHELAEAYPRVEPVILHAMSWSAELGVAAVSPAAGAALRLLAAASMARHVVELGTGTGVSGLWLLAGMRPDGVLTSIDIEPEHQALARQSFAAAGHALARTRLIIGNTRTVLARLADASYDLIFVDDESTGYADSVAAAHRLLRPGGLLVAHNALGLDGYGVDATSDDIDARAIAHTVAAVRNSPLWTPTLLHAGTGLLCATKTPRVDLGQIRMR